MAETLENKVLHALGQVIDHDSDQNIVSLGLVKDITTEEGKVSCVLEFNEIDQKKNEKIYKKVKCVHLIDFWQFKCNNPSIIIYCI